MLEFDTWTILKEIDENTTLSSLNEITSTRYSVEINYRSKKKEVLLAFAKIILGYISAALKQNGYHIKHVFDEEPQRIIVSTRNYDDGEYTLLISYNPQQECFIISKGFYNQERKSVSVTNSEVAKGYSAAEIVQQVRNIMFELQKLPDRHQEKMNPVPLKRGPKS
jgi:hypothetical protein